MNARHIPFYLIAAASLLCGCDRRPQSVAVAPATLPSAPTTDPSTREVTVPVEMLIDDQPYDFPPAKLSVSNNDEQLLALLVTEDPVNAAADDYRGNDVYLQMKMDIPDTNTLAGAQWVYKSTEQDRNDELDGIYLNGRRKFLQPQDVTVKLVDGQSPTKIAIDGVFLEFDDDSAQPEVGKTVTVHAQLKAGLKVDSPDK